MTINSYQIPESSHFPFFFDTVPPKIDDQQTEFTVVQDREVVLPCRASGTPPPRITWEKDGQPIPPGDFHFRMLRTGWLAIPIVRSVCLDAFISLT